MLEKDGWVTTDYQLNLELNHNKNIMKYILTILITFLCLSGISQTTNDKSPYTVITDFNKRSWKSFNDTSLLYVETNNIKSIEVLNKIYNDELKHICCCSVLPKLDTNKYGNYVFHFEYHTDVLVSIVNELTDSNVKFKIAEYRKEYSKFVKEDGKIEIIKN